MEDVGKLRKDPALEEKIKKIVEIINKQNSNDKSFLDRKPDKDPLEVYNYVRSREMHKVIENYFNSVTIYINDVIFFL